MPAPWTLTSGSSPLMAAAIHHGHLLRPELVPWMALSPEDRLREEDPWTGSWTRVADNAVVVHRSRFEVDLNRPRDKAVYSRPEDAWGLRVWRCQPPENALARSLALYDQLWTSGRARSVRGNWMRWAGPYNQQYRVCWRSCVSLSLTYRDEFPARHARRDRS